MYCRFGGENKKFRKGHGMTIKYSFAIMALLLGSSICLGTALAADKVVVVPHSISKRTCEGTPNGSRWCDNGDGTVTDLHTGLIWLKHANCFGSKKWVDIPDANPPEFDDALTKAGTLNSSANSCGLSDGSTSGAWRLPTRSELYDLTHGTEPVRYATPRAFTNVIQGYYWTFSTPYLTIDKDKAYYLNLDNGAVLYGPKTDTRHVLPVRSP